MEAIICDSIPKPLNEIVWVVSIAIILEKEIIEIPYNAPREGLE